MTDQPTELFHVLQDVQCVIQTKKGVFKQCKVYYRGQHLYAGTAGGFIRLYSGNRTSNPDLRLEGVTGPVPALRTNNLGWIELASPVEQKAIASGLPS